MSVSRIIFTGGLLMTTIIHGSSATPITPDLEAVGRQEGWIVRNRTVALIEKDGRIAVQFDARPSDGVAWIEGLDFQNGAIECDLLGRSKPIQGSFIGIAFRIQDEETLDAVYFRPFNFCSEDSTRRSHEVQYISLPGWTWRWLRMLKPGQYEQPIVQPPDGDSWFHVRIEIQRPTVRVFVDHETEPSLVVEELSQRTGGSVGFYMGYGSPGIFANLTIDPH